MLPDHTLRRLELPESDHALTWREYGDPAGRPVFFFHGWPGEAQQGVMAHAAAVRRGLRLISPNRPGIGGTTSRPGRIVADWPPLLAALADALQIEKLSILGLSGGGPYTLACARLLPERVEKVVTVCGALPAATPEERRHLSPVYRAMLGLHDHAPWMLRAGLAPLVRVARVRPPRPLFHLMLKTLGPRDRLALSDPVQFNLFFPGFVNALRAGSRGLWEDGSPYAKPWGFDVEGIRVPVSMWHGGEDRNFFIAGAEALAARVPGATFHRREEGHYSILPFCVGDILDEFTGPGAR